MKPEKPGRSLETEVKFIAPGEEIWDAFAGGGELNGYLVQPKARERLRSVYLDTREWSLLRAGIALRLRTRRGSPGCELTAKWSGSVAGGVHCRPEHSVFLRSRPQLPLRKLPPELAAVLTAVVAGRPLGAVLVTEVDRTTLGIVRARGRNAREVAELALDRVRLGRRRAGQIGPDREVELEQKEGTSQELRALAAVLRRRFGLRPQPSSKFERGLRAFYRQVPRFGAIDERRRNVVRALECVRACDVAVRLGARRTQVARLLRAMEGALAVLDTGERREAWGAAMAAYRRLVKAEALLGLAERARKRPRGESWHEDPAVAAQRQLSEALASSAYFDFLVRLETAACGRRMPQPKA